jgi:hypothetical protein
MREVLGHVTLDLVLGVEVREQRQAVRFHRSFAGKT